MKCFYMTSIFTVELTVSFKITITLLDLFNDPLLICFIYSCLHESENNSLLQFLKTSRRRMLNSCSVPDAQPGKCTLWFSLLYLQPCALSSKCTVFIETELYKDPHAKLWGRRWELVAILPNILVTKMINPGDTIMGIILW